MSNKTLFHHYRIDEHKIWYGYSSESYSVGLIRFYCETPEIAIQKIKEFSGNGWIITPFLIDYEIGFGKIVDEVFKEFALE